MDYNIRFATDADTVLIFDFIKGIAEYEKLSHQVEATPEKIKKHLFEPNAVAECLLAFEGEQAVGFAVFFHNYSTFVSKHGIYLEDLFVNPEYRGKGYGKALLLKIVEIAKQRDCGRVEWSVLDWNKPAIDFYESIGAVAIKGWTVYRLDEKMIGKITA